LSPTRTRLEVGERDAADGWGQRGSEIGGEGGSADGWGPKAGKERERGGMRALGPKRLGRVHDAGVGETRRGAGWASAWFS